MSLTTIINYDTPGNFIYDANKIEFVGNRAVLKLYDYPNRSFLQDFSSDVGFTYNSALVEFVAGVLRQKNQRIANALCGHKFDTANLNWGDGSLVGTLNGAAVITAGKLDLTAGAGYLEMSGVSNAGFDNIGTIKFKVTPNYSGAPVSVNYFVNIAESSGYANRVRLVHHTAGTGGIYLYLQDDLAVNIAGGSLGGQWLPTSGVEYEFELNIDTTTGATRLFIDGVLFGTNTGIGTLNCTDSTRIFIGSDDAGTSNYDGSFDDFVIFDATQHTANYTPGYTLPNADYVANTVNLPDIVYSGLGAVQSIDSIVKTGANPPAHSSSFGATTVSVDLDFSDANTMEEIDSLDTEYTGQIYPTDNPKIELIAPIAMSDIVDFVSTEVKAGLNEIKYLLRHNGNYYYLVGDVPTLSDGTYAQSNTYAEITTALLSGPIDINPDAPVYIVAMLHSEDGLSFPELETLTISYNYFFVPTALGICGVYGVIVDNAGIPIGGAKISIDSDDNLNNENIIAASAEVYSDEEGKFTLPCVETTTTVTTASITIEYKQNGKTKKHKIQNVVIPNQPTAKISDL